ncbi:hypothetical protein [Nitrosococcus watsonii]|uniref:Transmembrane protein n=1 Tax=Nitrosococcus watsoni (strain C-113) TaxID=105559 RepID=D8K506_NITWC|nr:hypothetical protein [Nitrosococcus watsonii]ADJ27983.1 conserved hypothetical protein [Nitrosococcus watsonii C-113]
MLLYWALGLFLAGALGGVVMATRSFRGQEIPWLLAAAHGVLVASGLVLLIAAVILGTAPGILKVALGLLIVAALGGFYLLSFQVRQEPHPRQLIVVHALLAVTGVLLLLWTLLQQPPSV